jgi:TraY domain-containing protein
MTPGQAKRGTFATRLRPQLKARLEKAALENGRSLSEEVEVRLEESERYVEELHRAQQQSASAMRSGFLLGCQSSALAAFIGASLERIDTGLASDPRSAVLLDLASAYAARDRVNQTLAAVQKTRGQAVYGRIADATNAVNELQGHFTKLAATLDQFIAERKSQRKPQRKRG